MILGEPDEFTDWSPATPACLRPTWRLRLRMSRRRPPSLAWDGTNLYVADPTDFRILVFTPEAPSVQQNGVVNSASLRDLCLRHGGHQRHHHARRRHHQSTIDGTNYTYTVVTNDTFDTIVAGPRGGHQRQQQRRGRSQRDCAQLVGFGTCNSSRASRGRPETPLRWRSRSHTDATETVDHPAIPSSTAAATHPRWRPEPSSPLREPVWPGRQHGRAQSHHSELPLNLGGVEVYVDGIQSPILFVSPTAGQRADSV